MKTKTCFVICPIGEEGSIIRRRSDNVFNHIITPVVIALGYTPQRADMIAKPGLITSQVIMHVLNDDLVIADLSSSNPNVFYELALRHAVKKPVVQLIQTGETIPFDIANSRTIYFDPADLASVAYCKTSLESQIKEIEKDPTLIDNPLSSAIDLEQLKKSKSPIDKTVVELTELLKQEVIPNQLEMFRELAGMKRDFDSLYSSRLVSTGQSLLGHSLSYPSGTSKVKTLSDFEALRASEHKE